MSRYAWHVYVFWFLCVSSDDNFEWGQSGRRFWLFTSDQSNSRSFTIAVRFEKWGFVGNKMQKAPPNCTKKITLSSFWVARRLAWHEFLSMVSIFANRSIFKSWKKVRRNGVSEFDSFVAITVAVAFVAAPQYRHSHRLSDPACDFHSFREYFQQYNRKVLFRESLRRSLTRNLR